MTPSSARVEGLARGLLQYSEPNSTRKEDQAMSEDQKITNKRTRSIARQLARELQPEELDVVAAGCTGANSSTFCNDQDDYCVK
jgi:hypothetical protein